MPQGVLIRLETKTQNNSVSYEFWVDEKPNLVNNGAFQDGSIAGGQEDWGISDVTDSPLKIDGWDIPSDYYGTINAVIVQESSEGSGIYGHPYWNSPEVPAELSIGKYFIAIKSVGGDPFISQEVYIPTAGQYKLSFWIVAQDTEIGVTEEQQDIPYKVSFGEHEGELKEEMKTTPSKYNNSYVNKFNYEELEPRTFLSSGFHTLKITNMSEAQYGVQTIFIANVKVEYVTLIPDTGTSDKHEIIIEDKIGLNSGFPNPDSSGDYFKGVYQFDVPSSLPIRFEADFIDVIHHSESIQLEYSEGVLLWDCNH
ncbi:MAG: hypothetical protein Ct9H90mP28_4260 [Paracoccaceae bacterium]|nr:MAG: hypothetical protein Ct9H90mP28_4260 [Paracoccaceae bacterium]